MIAHLTLKESNFAMELVVQTTYTKTPHNCEVNLNSLKVVRKEGLEPSPLGDIILSHARLPIPPLPHRSDNHYKQQHIGKQGQKTIKPTEIQHPTHPTHRYYQLDSKYYS